MKTVIFVVLTLSVLLSACNTVKQTAGGLVGGIGKDIENVGTAGQKLADKIRN